MTTRGELLSLLTDACELEHGLACSYLFAAFSLKQDLGEGMDWREQQIARRWAAQLYFVASQEMSHLAQAWNLLTAIGGTPYYLRPNVPVSPRNYPLSLSLELLPYSAEALERFVNFEQPEQPQFAAADYRTVGELYSHIKAGFSSIDETTLFIGDPTAQCGPDVGHFRELIKVTDRASAVRGIDTIREQGEGTVKNHQDCHFGIFRQLQDELAHRTNALARAVVKNPATRPRNDQLDRPVTLIKHHTAARAAELFDDLYATMLRMLSHAFADHAAAIDRGRWAGAAIDLMVTAIKPMGEAVTLFPVEDGSSQRAGAPFGLSRHVPLPSRGDIATIVLLETFGALAKTASALAVETRDALGPTFEASLAAARVTAVERSLLRATESLRS